MHKLLLASLSLCILLSDTTYAMDIKKKGRTRKKGQQKSEQLTYNESDFSQDSDTLEIPKSLPASSGTAEELSNSSLSQSSSISEENVQTQLAVETMTTEPDETAFTDESSTVNHCSSAPAAEAAAQPAQEPEKEKTKASLLVERPISAITKLRYFRSDHMTYALGLLTDHTGTKKEIGHQVDRAIAYTHEQLETLAKNKSLDSIETIEAVIKLQEPHIANLRTLIQLTEKHKIQAQETSLSLAWRTMQAHNLLRIKRAALVCKEDTSELKKNKTIGHTILDLAYEKETLEEDVSDEEYNDLTGMFCKIEAEINNSNQ